MTEEHIDHYPCLPCLLILGNDCQVREARLHCLQNSNKNSTVCVFCFHQCFLYFFVFLHCCKEKDTPDNFCSLRHKENLDIIVIFIYLNSK